MTRSSPRTTHLPIVRNRPAGTSEYAMLTRKALSTVIGSEGIEKPAHGPRISTS